MLSRNDVIRGLTQLAERLDADDINVVIHLVGGAAVMLTVRHDRQLTTDVDSWINSHGDEQLRSRVIEAVMLVGRANPGFPDDWLNDKASMFIPDLPALASACGVTTVREVEAIFDRYYPQDEMKPSARRWLTEPSGLI
jgi:hypothetical protein